VLLCAATVHAQRIVPERSPNEVHSGVSSLLRTTGSEAIYIEPGTFVMGIDTLGVQRAIHLCRRERDRLAAALRLSPSGDALDAAGRLMADQCTLVGAGAATCDPRQFAWELEAHTVWLGGFWLSRTEVTVAAYERCVEVGVCAASAIPSSARVFGGARLPVTGVAWIDASTYCHWRGGRLPTEAEWERAARGGDERPFPWGWQWDTSRANHGALTPTCVDADDGFALTAPVGSFAEGASREGALDLAGNVMEWVEDVAPEGPYASDHVVSPVRRVGSTLRVARGGAWDRPSYALRTTAREFVPAAARVANVGFRCVWETW
jgi:formylglycine-generating enzyme required for sulfatase activity